MELTSRMDQGQLKLLVVCREDYQWRQVGKCADIIMVKRIQPTEIVEVLPADQQQHANMPVRIRSDRWAECTAVLSIIVQH